MKSENRRRQRSEDGQPGAVLPVDLAAFGYGLQVRSDRRGDGAPADLHFLAVGGLQPAKQVFGALAGVARATAQDKVPLSQMARVVVDVLPAWAASAASAGVREFQSAVDAALVSAPDLSF